MKRQIKRLLLKPQLISNYARRINDYKHLHRSRKALQQLDERMLKDVGLTKEQVEKEVRMPFWKNKNYLKATNNKKAFKGSPSKKSLIKQGF